MVTCTVRPCSFCADARSVSCTSVPTVNLQAVWPKTDITR